MTRRPGDFATRRRPQRESGFTLIEVLVATTMFVIVLTAVYATFRSISDASIRAESSSEVSQTARVVLGDMTKRLAGFYPIAIQMAPAGSEGSTTTSSTDQPPLFLLGEDKMSVNGDFEADALSFVTTAEEPPDGRRLATGLVRVSYYLREDSVGTKLFIREIQPITASMTAKSSSSSGSGARAGGAPTTPAATTSGTDTPPQPEISIISDQVAVLNFQYFNKDTNEWEKSWSDPQNTPEVIEVQLGVRSRDPKALPQKFSQMIPLHPVTRYSKLPQSKAPTPTGGTGGGGSGGRGGGPQGGGGPGGSGGRGSGQGGPGALPAPDGGAGGFGGQLPGGGGGGQLPGGGGFPGGGGGRGGGFGGGRGG